MNEVLVNQHIYRYLCIFCGFIPDMIIVQASPSICGVRLDLIRQMGKPPNFKPTPNGEWLFRRSFLMSEISSEVRHFLSKGDFLRKI